MVCGEPAPLNPRHAVPPPWHDFVRLWGACRGGMGGTSWPDFGGVSDQAAWIVDAFGVLAGLDAKFDRYQREMRGKG